MNPITTKITVDMVEKFQIHDNFQQRSPCSHLCKIVLRHDCTKDSQKAKIKKSIRGPDIYILIQSIAKEKISFKPNEASKRYGPQKIDHFDKYAPEQFTYCHYRLDVSEPPSADEILTEVFNNKDRYG